MGEDAGSGERWGLKGEGGRSSTYRHIIWANKLGRGGECAMMTDDDKTLWQVEEDERRWRIIGCIGHPAEHGRSCRPIQDHW